MFSPTFIQNSTNAVQISYDNASWQNIEKGNITAVTGQAVYGTGRLSSSRTDRLNQFMVRIRMTDGSYVDFDIQDVQNQVTWTANQAGLNNAVSTIQGWL